MVMVSDIRVRVRITVRARMVVVLTNIGSP